MAMFDMTQSTSDDSGESSSETQFHKNDTPKNNMAMFDLTQCTSDDSSESASEVQFQNDDRHTHSKTIECETACSSNASASDMPLEEETVQPIRRFE